MAQGGVCCKSQGLIPGRTVVFQECLGEASGQYQVGSAEMPLVTTGSTKPLGPAEMISPNEAAHSPLKNWMT